MQVPLFPLNTVLFPGGPLPLRIFEPRYLDMISERLKADAPFGVLLIREGEEVGPASTFNVGTLATICDWYQGSDGLLGVTAIGGQRFRLLSSDSQTDGLNIGEVELLPDEPQVVLPPEYGALPPILDAVIDDLGRLYEGLERKPDDATWLSYRFIEVLPIELEQKQYFLESDDALARLHSIAGLLDTQRDA